MLFLLKLCILKNFCCLCEHGGPKWIRPILNMHYIIHDTLFHPQFSLWGCLIREAGPPV